MTPAAVRDLIETFKRALHRRRVRRHFPAQRQLEHALSLVECDRRWLASDDVASALCERYIAALSANWHTFAFEDCASLRRRLGLDPVDHRYSFNLRKAEEVCRLRALLDEIRHCFTTDDALPDDLLPRIDKALDEGTL